MSFQSLDGRRLETLFTVSYPPALSQSFRLLIGITDVTQAKKARAAQEKSERRYRDLFRFLPISLWQLDNREVIGIFAQARDEGVCNLYEYLESRPELSRRAMESMKIVEVNERTVSMLRASSVVEFGGSVARYWTHSPQVFNRAMAARYDGAHGYEAEIRVPAHDGTVLDALFFAEFAPVTGEQDVTLIGLIDVSDRVRAQEQLAQLQAELAHAARVSMLGELTASIAHEVSQPLTAIGTNTDAAQKWLKRDPPDLKEVAELAARTAFEVQRAADIIHRIRAMAVRSEPQRASLQLNPMIEEAVLFLRHELQRNGVHVSLSLADGLPAVLGDRVQLQQVIVNLAVNAMQAMHHEERAARRLSIQSVALENGHVLVGVEDSGPGIPPEVREKVFDSFFTTKSTGMGMGLTICRTIIEAHGGSIEVANRLNASGAHFTFRLPPRQPGSSAP